MQRWFLAAAVNINYDWLLFVIFANFVFQFFQENSIELTLDSLTYFLKVFLEKLQKNERIDTEPFDWVTDEELEKNCNKSAFLCHEFLANSKMPVLPSRLK